ncbi:hypothetical protein [Frigidibacter sp. SD6-1]|uniref:hypothetical protein n=1 Tax=Frigidibacter sp. SD6-1 TaxID=3032581 RepID=UPI0024DFCD11|nr:hypothetical protein [Frigidibacter sp. SD6-1]
MRVHCQVAAVAAVAVFPGWAQALCVMETDGARCVSVVPANLVTSSLAVGDRIPEGTTMLFNPEYHGLPPVTGYWRYYRIDGRVYEVHPETMEVLAIVGDGNSSLR